MTNEEVLKNIEEFFEDNFEMLRYEAGHDITQNVKDIALLQVKKYWEKLNYIANRVTETEVKLALPNQTSKEGRKFTIEGVVDIVREGEETWMYDIKTHEKEYIESNIEMYEQQLNVYAHIWQNLRGNKLDHTAIISTSIPKLLQNAIRYGPEEKFKKEFENWEPLIELDLQQQRIEDLIKKFGKTVDEIENNKFKPVTISRLKERAGGSRSHEIFATRVCRNCDGRFSCSSFREYAAQSKGQNIYNFRKFWTEQPDDAEQEDWMSANINTAQIDSSAEFADTL